MAVRSQEKFLECARRHSDPWQCPWVPPVPVSQVSCPLWCRCGDQDEDAAHDRDPPRLPALHPQVQPLREAPQEHVSAPVPLLQVCACVTTPVLAGVWCWARTDWGGTPGWDRCSPHLERAHGYDVQTHDGLQNAPAEGLLTMPLACTEPGTTFPEEQPGGGSEGQGEPWVLSDLQVSLQGCADRGHRDSGRVPPPQQDRALQRAQGDQGCRHQETVPEVLTPVGRGVGGINVGKVELRVCELE